MAAADHGGPRPDLYQLLGVPRDASREEIAQAWREAGEVDRAGQHFYRTPQTQKPAKA